MMDLVETGSSPTKTEFWVLQSYPYCTQCSIHCRASGNHRPPADRSPQLQQPQVDERDRAQPGGGNDCFGGGVATGDGAVKAAGGGGDVFVEAVEAEAVPFVRNGLDGGAASVGDANALR